MTLTELMARRVAADPQRTYFTLFGQRVTYGQFWEMSRRHAGGASEHGPGRFRTGTG